MMLGIATSIVLTAYSVTDGDTLRAGDLRIRLWGIDAPEPGEPGGHAAAATLETILGGTELRCEIKGGDRFGRIVARCTLPDGSDPACAPVRLGLARDWPKYSGGAYEACSD